MITEALLDKIKALISGYKQPAHPLYGKSDKEVAGVIKSMVSSYLTESKQQLIEDDLNPIINESKWEPAGVDKNKTYTGVKFVQLKFRELWLKFKAELKTKFGIDVDITSAYRDPYNQGRIMYVNWLRRKPQYRFGYLNGLYGRNGGKISKIFSSYYTPGTTTISPSNLTTALDEVEKFITQSAMTISRHLKNTAVDLNIVKGNKYFEPIKTWVNSGKSKYAYKALDEGNHIHINLRLTPGASDAVSTKSNVLQYGDSGKAVRKLQNQLAVLYTTAPLGTSGIDGKFGPKTRDLLKKYQREHGLPVSGKLTSVTKAELEKIDMSAEDAVAGLKPGPVLVPIMKLKKFVNVTTTPNTDKETEIDTQRPQTISQLPLLRYGSTGPDVKNIQLKLINLYGDKILPKHGADGKFKSETQTAVKKFQRDNKLTVDGIVGQNTYKTLYKYFPTVTVNPRQDMESDTNNDLAVDELKEMIEQWPLYRKILKEETQRARILMFEYNEEEIWNTMSDPEKSQALMSADDDMGPDFADEFTDTPWLKIPDVITNRIDLRSYSKPEKEKLSRQDFMSKDRDMRGMSYQSKEDDAYKRFIEAYLKKQNIQIDYSQNRPLYKALNQLSKDQVRDLFFKAHDFRASMSKFVPPTPEEQEQSRNSMKTWIDQDRIDNPRFSRD